MSRNHLWNQTTPFFHPAVYSATATEYAAVIAAPIFGNQTMGMAKEYFYGIFVELALFVIPENSYCTMLYRYRHSGDPTRPLPAQELFFFCSQNWTGHSLTCVLLPIAFRKN